MLLLLFLLLLLYILPLTTNSTIDERMTKLQSLWAIAASCAPQRKIESDYQFEWRLWHRPPNVTMTSSNVEWQPSDDTIDRGEPRNKWQQRHIVLISSDRNNDAENSTPSTHTTHSGCIAKFNLTDKQGDGAPSNVVCVINFLWCFPYHSFDSFGTMRCVVHTTDNGEIVRTGTPYELWY